jgi:hypothetical protein
MNGTYKKCVAQHHRQMTMELPKSALGLLDAILENDDIQALWVQYSEYVLSRDPTARAGSLRMASLCLNRKVAAEA